MGSLLTLNQVSKCFGTLRVIDQMSLEIREFERVVLLGHSGSGKTTFLRLIAGLETPTSGEITRESDQIGFVFQEPRLIPWRSVYDNLRFVSKKHHKNRIIDILTQLRLHGFEDYLPAQLSGGMQQRVNLARALIVEPKILILDEAFGSLDLPVKLAIMEDLLALWKKHRFTVIAVTHDLKEALCLADRILIFSPRPARIAHDIPISLPKERSFASPQLLAEEARLLEILTQMK